jgi:hypothetical protein
LTELRNLFPGVPLVESPLFHSIIEDLGFCGEERRVALELHERGYAIIDFRDEELEHRIERIKDFLEPYFECDMADPQAVKNNGSVQRVQDGWLYNEDIRAIASNERILELLGKLYGRSAFPFQTLNFPVGTQQHLHSDSIHFSSMPERFMCGVWLAMEDIAESAGPLTYLPGSHKWPIINNAMIGRRGFESPREHAQQPFEKAWRALVQQSGVAQETFQARKGQALIWAANLLHGGSPQTDPTRTRWSQVTHYYFDDCAYYTPSFSDEALGQLDLRSIVDVGTGEPKPNLYLGKPLETAAEPVPTASFLKRLQKRLQGRAGLPDDFDPETYYRLNPDVAVAKFDAATHYLSHGKVEGRRYKFRIA